MGPVRVKKRWEHRVRGQIWRIFPAEAGLLIGEDRDARNRQVSFFCLDALEGTPVWQNMTMPEPWWVSIEAVAGNLLFLHEFPVPSMPDHRKIFAVDTATGNLIWKNEELSFGFSTGTTIYASRELFDRRVFYELDPSTGEILREADGEAVRRFGETVPVPAGPGFETPSPGRPLPGPALELLGGRQVVGDPEHIDLGQASVFSCYELFRPADAERPLREHLFVTDASGDGLLYHDILASGARMNVPGSFFRFGDLVYYLREKSTICSLMMS